MPDGGSPPKRPRLQAAAPPKASTSKVERKRTSHTHSEVWKWTFAPDAVAPCRVQDVHAMEECDGTKDAKDPDFYWLGRVPCRSVLLYGVIVGVQQYEQRTVYSLDDGTAQIECNMRHMVPPSPVKASFKHHPNSSPRKGPPPGPRNLGRFGGMPPLPKPVAVVGDIVRVQGRVLNRHYTRMINTDSIVVCRNPTEEPLHWLAVAELQSTYYHPPSPEFFVIPKPTIQPTPAPFKTVSKGPDRTQASTSKITLLDPASPSKSSVASSAPSTPSSVRTTSDRGPMSPPRLRHPSRLHTRDLTANTFRIYLKHYMDNAPREPLRRQLSQNLDQGYSSDEDADFGQLRAWLDNEPGTPTKTRPATRKMDDATPRPGKSRTVSDETPRASTVNTGKGTSDLAGFTLSHLRRVPEISLLARRVVDAEAKRRTRDERKKQKEQATQNQSKGRPSVSTKSGSSAILKPASAVTARLGELKSAKMKRLFRYAIRQLYEEGSIVLWDGPVRALPLPPLPALSFSAPSAARPAGTSGLWKMGSCAPPPASAVSGVLSRQGAEEEDEEDGQVSDPPDDEESYVPLSLGYLCTIVEGAIKDIMARPVSHRTDGWKKTGPTPGPTPEEITSHLHRRDERWARVGDWAVKDALDWGKSEGRVWCIGGSRWEVCG